MARCSLEGLSLKAHSFRAVHFDASVELLITWGNCLPVGEFSEMVTENSASEIIAAWFRQHEDGEFCVLPEEHSSLRIGEYLTAPTTVYLTKPNQIERCQQAAIWPIQAAVIGRYGLPIAADIALLRESNQVVEFVGDADPVDLLVFAWLREHVSIRWLGVSDSLLHALGIEPWPRIQIRLAPSEQETIGQLARLCPDYRTLLGTKCTTLLEAGWKIELEGALLASECLGS